MRAFLSPPCLNGDAEQRLIAEALASNYIAPCGPMVDALEREAAARFDFAEALATTSGTMALELLARALEIRPGDVVIASDLTFIASVAPFVTLRAKPVFVDAHPDTWCIDPVLLEQALAAHPHARAVIATDLYGQCCDVDVLAACCARYGVPLIVDAAESVGATYRGRASGKGAWATVYSLNGNKIITCGGGGLLLSDDLTLMARARKLASQGREAVAWYEHRQVGTHGRLGNVPAAIGLAQLRHLDDALADKARVWDDWMARCADKPWISPMPTADYGTPNRWLTVVTLEGRDPIAAAAHLVAHGIEARPLWKPMHLQPCFSAKGGYSTPADQSFDSAEADPRFRTGEHLFSVGLCLPSGRRLSTDLMDETLALLEAL